MSGGNCSVVVMMTPGMPIYGKIRFLRIFIACFSLRTKNFIYGRIYGFFRTEFGYYPPPPPPPPPTLDSRYFARAE